MAVHTQGEKSGGRRYTKDMGIRLTNDFVFKYIFGREENTPLLLDLVNAVLEDGGYPLVKELTLKNPVNLRSADWMKETVLDILAVDEKERRFDLEMQVTMDHSFLHRSLFYWAQIYSQQIEKGAMYSELRPVVCINLLDYIAFPERPGNHHCFLLADAKDPGTVLTDHLAIHFIELQKPPKAQGRLRLWTELIENAGLEGVDMEVLLSNDRLLKIAHSEYGRTAQDRELRALALSRERFQKDWNTRLAYAKEEGLQQGIEQGTRKSQEDMARRMAAEGIPVETISKITGLSEDALQSMGIFTP